MDRRGEKASGVGKVQAHARARGRPGRRQCRRLGQKGERILLGLERDGDEGALLVTLGDEGDLATGILLLQLRVGRRDLGRREPTDGRPAGPLHQGLREQQLEAHGHRAVGIEGRAGIHAAADGGEQDRSDED